MIVTYPPYFFGSRARRPSGRLLFYEDHSAYASVLKTEEKGSDVNLASLLLRDGFQNKYDVAVLVTNDSDLLLPGQIVRGDLGKKVGILNPYQKPSNVLRKNCDFYKPIRQGVLQASQLPETLTDEQGSFSKPPRW